MTSPATEASEVRTKRPNEKVSLLIAIDCMVDPFAVVGIETATQPSIPEAGTND
jgi:hypothetical protein